MEPPPTHGLACPLALAVAQAHTLQHVATRLMGATPGIANLVGLAALMAAICRQERGRADVRGPAATSSDTGQHYGDTVRATRVGERGKNGQSWWR